MKNILKYTFFGAFALLISFSCRKDAFEGTETGDSGTTHIKVEEGGEIKQFFGPFTDIKLAHLFSLRRDAANNADLNKTNTIKLESNAGIIEKYNEDNDESFEELPASFYTLASDAGINKTSTGYDFLFSSGEFSKNFKIKLDGSKWVDLSKKYSLAFRITDYNGLTPTAATSDSIIVLFSIKNKYDGVYEVTGTMIDVTNPAYTHVNDVLGADAPTHLQLRTISPTKCVLYDDYYIGGYFVGFNANGSGSYYGAFCPVFEFDPATDKIISVTNYYGQPAPNTRSAKLDPSGINQFDAESRTMSVTYNMLQPSVVTTPPNIRVTWQEVWKFIEERQ
ncbi:DUF1735 domain-containing protein [Pedobacter sp. HMF7647]|uniref:DUF1735 domain-containing protein n=1 Tax=Hufsiella arboris TaxID=2695275 RepID=A0A7K1Y5M1_9SPHI|nr:DUF1735 domain-containing protein [Hufsiella arboris]MXV49885.1 DUF1735 domain-containing protein [Hufsiella arboris]